MGVYELGRDSRALVQGMMLVSMGVWAVVAANSGKSEQIPFFVGIGALFLVAFVRWLFWVPRCIVLDDVGLTFVAQWRTLQVPWSELEKVKVSFGRYGGGITWRHRTGPKIVTSAAFEGVHRMLTEVEDRAPQARVLM